MNTPDNPPAGPITSKFSRDELDMMLAASIPNNLPAIRGQIVGREKEIATIQKFLGREDVRLVTLTGFGGIGKTTLALHAAHAMIKSFPRGVFFIDLGTVIDPELILPAIAKTLNIQEESQRPLSSTLKDFLSNRTILFLLDNFEQLVNGAPVVAGFMESNPCIHLLITSRENLRLRGEQVIPIQPLPVKEATALFIQRAQSLNPDFQTNEGDVAVIAELCARLDGLPLAIELAAMRTKMFAPPTLLARFKSGPEPASASLDLLESGARDLPARQQTLRNTIAWSYDLLTPVEQKTLRAASLFASGFDLDMLGQLAGTPQVETLETVSSLIDKHLIQVAAGHDSRFTLLNTIREFGHEKIRQHNEWQQLTNAYTRLYKNLAGLLAIEIENGDSTQAMNRLDVEHNNLLIALELALQSGDEKRFAAGIYLMAGLEQYWFQHGYFIESEKYINRALQQDGEQVSSDAHLSAILYGLKGTLQWACGDFEGAAKYHQQAIVLCEQCGDEVRLARAMNNLAVNLDELSDHENAGRYYETGLALSQKIGDNWNHLRMLNNMGIRAHHLLKDSLRAEGYWQAALALIPAQSKSFENISIQFNLACMGYNRKEFERTAALLNDIIEVAGEKNFPRIRACACGLQTLIRLEQRDIKSAASLLLDALEVSHSIREAALSYELFECAALLSMTQKRHNQATKLLAGADAHTDKEPIRRVLPLWTGFDKTVKTLALALGHTAFERAWDEGKNLTYEDLHLLALRVCQLPKIKPTPTKGTTLLTRRESDTLRLMAQGKTNQDISQELFVTLKTVEKHVANILHKLGVRNRTEATAWAIQQNLLETGMRKDEDFHPGLKK
jgi:predicted ATPase/DNA-binding CsgD family transcriptional regulator